MNNILKQKKIIAGMFAVLTLFLASSPAQALEGVVRIRLSYGLANYSSPSTGADISATYATLGLGATYIFPSNVFMDFTTKVAGSGSTYNAPAASGGLVNTDQAYSRTENTLTVGMPLDNGFQGNAGIFTAETIFKLNQFGQFSQKMQGLTTGIGKGLPINEGKSGALGLNAAFALLKATSGDRFGGEATSNIAFGLSIGATYSYMLRPNLGVSADTKFQSYFIKYSTFSGDERIISAALSLIGQF